MQLVKDLYEAARPLKPCRLFTGQETLKELIQKFKTPQGIEFCLAKDFPQDRFIPELKKHGLEVFDVHIDAGRQTEYNPKCIVLVGNTDFTIFCDTLSHACKIVLMKGARARIKALGYAVVSIEAQEGCKYDVDKSEHAIVK